MTLSTDGYFDGCQSTLGRWLHKSRLQSPKRNRSNQKLPIVDVRGFFASNLPTRQCALASKRGSPSEWYFPWSTASSAIPFD